MRITLILIFLFVMGCAAKFNTHLGPDGQGGYLRTYRSFEKGNPKTRNTGIERCTVQGSDIICRDLKILHKEEKSGLF